MAPSKRPFGFLSALASRWAKPTDKRSNRKSSNVKFTSDSSLEENLEGESSHKKRWGRQKQSRLFKIKLSSRKAKLAQQCGPLAIAAGFEVHTAPRRGEKPSGPKVHFNLIEKANEQRSAGQDRCHGPSMGVTLHHIPSPPWIPDHHDEKPEPSFSAAKLQVAAAWERVSWNRNNETQEFRDYMRVRHIPHCSKHSCAKFYRHHGFSNASLPTLDEYDEEEQEDEH